MPAVKARNRNSALAAEVTQAHAGAKFGSSFMSGRFRFAIIRAIRGYAWFPDLRFSALISGKGFVLPITF